MKIIGFADDVAGKVLEESHADGEPSRCNDPTVTFDEEPTIGRLQNQGCSCDEQEDCGELHPNLVTVIHE